MVVVAGVTAGGVAGREGVAAHDTFSPVAKFESPSD
jgi:hypothetical protein